jgi:hypothetical protein
MTKEQLNTLNTLINRLENITASALFDVETDLMYLADDFNRLYKEISEEPTEEELEEKVLDVVSETDVKLGIVIEFLQAYHAPFRSKLTGLDIEHRRQKLMNLDA